jgi:hypothetical protein
MRYAEAALSSSSSSSSSRFACAILALTLSGAAACRGIIGIEPLVQRDGGGDGGDGPDASATAESGAPCPSELTGDPFAADLRSCALLGTDTASDGDPIPFWGQVTCVETGRHARLATGGDPHADAFGITQGNEAFRRLTIFDGDMVFGAERCDLGRNDRETGPTVFYREGDHVLTMISVRVPQASMSQTAYYQEVMQIQRTNPATGSGASIQIELAESRWNLMRGFEVLWSAPARPDVWTRFAVDAHYTQLTTGRLRAFVDLDGDGDASDPNEQSGTYEGATLQTQSGSGGTGELPQGAPIPSHLRSGVNHDPAMSCPSPSGCHVDVDNVQVIRLGR